MFHDFKMSSKDCYIFQIIVDSPIMIMTIGLDTECRCKEIVDTIHKRFIHDYDGNLSIRGADGYWEYAKNKQELYDKIIAADLVYCEETDLEWVECPETRGSSIRPRDELKAIIEGLDMSVCEYELEMLLDRCL